MTGRHDVVGVGANSVDFVYRLPAYPRPDSPFAKLPITEHLICCGGQVTTTLATCAAMGLRTSYIGTLGSDEHAARMREELRRRGIDASHAVVRDAGNPFAVILLDDREGERVVLWKRDSRLALGPGEIDRATVAAARLLHVDDVDLDASVEAARIAGEAGVPVTSDIERTGDDIRALIDAVTVPIFAEHVPAALTGETDLSLALGRLLRPHHQMLCVTRGPRGAVMLAGGEFITEPGITVRTVDTTGAGDVFRGAFIYALLRGDEPRDILRFANAAAAVSCTRVGAMASVPSLADVTHRH
ncbi:MAG TPA: PfkB family carbohydrate kinase [Vicinamibacterales bacterium]